MLVASQIEGTYEAEDEKMASYLAQAKALMLNFTTYKVKHIKRSENKQADVLRKLASTFTFVAHPQENGEVECANRSIVDGIKRRHDGFRSGWINQVAHILLAILTQKNTGNAETPFSLTYGTEALVPAEIGLPSPRVLALGAYNECQWRLDLMLLEERRELSAMREQNYKRQLQKYYDASVKICEFNTEDYVLRNNEASRAHSPGKLSPT
ncbi:uncharacterized protein LOC143631252 [Bidens hawaiensis]|uniref:uncharacterized protein LOC143597882 n=1 Tax=Bidens hawaiensis TaxID=980011 RepID=UPI00404B4067